MRAQVTLFAIIAILIVSAAGATYYLVSQSSKSLLNMEQRTVQAVPEKFRPAEENFISCLKQKAQDSLTILGSQGGYINLPAEDPASDYMPFSSQMNFLGMKIPYWWYVSGNNIQKNQVPSMDFMSNEIKSYMDANAEDCESSLRLFEGLEFNAAEQPSTKVTISDDYVGFEVDYPIALKYSNTSISVQKHEFAVVASLGKLYSISKGIMDKENSNYFIEERTIDAMFLYPEIPSTSMNFECSPKIWTRTAVQESIKKVIANNIPFIKIKGTNYGNADKYFEIDTGKTDSSVQVNMVPLTEPFKFDVIPSDGELMKGDAIVGDGENEALDFMKSLFCISSYHFVYTVGYPVLIQLTDKNGYMFQFPVLALIANNQPKENRLGGEGMIVQPELCMNKLATETVSTYYAGETGNLFTLSDVDVSFKCIATTCGIGQTKKGTLTAVFPQCLNGFIIARKGGYHPSKYQISTNTNDQEVSLILEPYKNYTLSVFVIEKDGKTREVKNDETIIINFKNELKEHNVDLVYPTQNKVGLLRENYSVKLSLFEKGTFSIAGKTVSQCTDIPREGILGFIGLKQEQCFDFESPSIKLEQVFGGGSEFYLDVKKGDAINLYLIKTDVPKNADELDAAYASAKNAVLDRNFKQPEIK